MTVLIDTNLIRHKLRRLTSGVGIDVTAFFGKGRSVLCRIRLCVVPRLECPQRRSERRRRVNEVVVVAAVSVEAAGTRPVQAWPLTTAAAAIAFVRRPVKTTGVRSVEGPRSRRHVVAAGDDATAKLQIIVGSQCS